MKGLKEIVVGTGSTICGILIEIIATAEKNIYWAITDGYYERSNIYNISIILIIVGIILIILGFKKKI